MALLAIEFDDQNLLVTAARSGIGQLRITHVFQISSDGKTDEAIGEELKQQIQSLGIGKCDGVVVVGRSKTEIRELSVPPAPEDELPDMIRFQARKEFASLDDDWPLDYVPLKVNDGATTQVLAAAMPPELEQSIKTICGLANVKLKRILLRPFAAADLIKSQFSDGALRLIVDQNTDTTDLSILDGQRLLATRTVRMPAQLESDKRSKLMIAEVRRTLAAARTSTAGRKVEHVVISGEEKRNRLLAGDLAGPLELNVEFVQPFESVGVERKIDVNAIERPGRYMSSLGGLKTELAGGRPELDFLNPRRPVIKKVDYRKYWYCAALAATIGLIGLFCAWSVLRSQQSEIAEQEAILLEKVSLNEGTNGQPSVDQRVAEIQKIDQWKLDEVNWLVELSEFSQRYLLPDDVIADSFVASVRPNFPGTINLNGRIVDELSKTDQLIESLGTRPYSVEPIDTGVDNSQRDSKLRSTFEYLIKIVEPATEESSNPMLELDRKALNYLQAQKTAAP